MVEMDHPNIVKFYQCVYDNNYVNIVMELIKGKPLSDYLIENRRIPEEKCQYILNEIMAAFKYQSSKGIVHRDLKLDNIILINTESGNIKDLRVKLIDFGMSKLIKSSKKINLSTYCGTIDFIAPEVFQGNYDKACDLWSIGVIAFCLLSGQTPFYGRDSTIIQQKIITCDYKFDTKVWKIISQDAQSWISCLL